jgi:hypothetical protein
LLLSDWELGGGGVACCRIPNGGGGTDLKLL